jgi:hypothetical protein
MTRLAITLVVTLTILCPVGVYADISKLSNASVMGLKLGDTYKEVCNADGVGDWSGRIGNPRFRDNGTLRSVPPPAKEPYDAQLNPPAGTKYLGGELRALNLYFDFEDGEFRLFAIAFKVEGVPLEGVLTKQFGDMNTGSGWADDRTMLLLNNNEVLVFDIRTREAAEVWYYKNRANFSPQ